MFTAVSVPAKLDSVVTTLPRLPDQRSVVLPHVWIEKPHQQVSMTRLGFDLHAGFLKSTVQKSFDVW